MPFLVNIGIEVIGIGEDAGHYHRAPYQGIMDEAEMQGVQSSVVMALVSRGNEKAGLEKKSK